MSLKENVNYVKDELNTEEKFLESFVKVERFYKKYKLIIIVAIVIIIAAIIALYTTRSIQDANKLEANIAFNKVIENPKDTEAMNILKEKSAQLFQVAQYIQANKEGKFSDTQVKYLKELVEYQKALETKDVLKLNTISMQNDFLLKEFAIFNKALILTNQGKYEDARSALQLISADSKVNDLANTLKHFLVTK